MIGNLSKVILQFMKTAESSLTACRSLYISFNEDVDAVLPVIICYSMLGYCAFNFSCKS